MLLMRSKKKEKKRKKKLYAIYLVLPHKGLSVHVHVHGVESPGRKHDYAIMARQSGLHPILPTHCCVVSPWVDEYIAAVRAFLLAAIIHLHLMCVLICKCEGFWQRLYVYGTITTARG